MPDMLIDNSTVFKSISSFLNAQLSLPVGDSTAPLQDGTSHQEEYPYLVLREVDSKDFYGPAFVAPEADGCLMYTITTYGQRADQVRLVSEKVKRTILGRVNGHGIFLFPILVPDHKIMMRSLGLKGRLRQQGTVFSIEDIYEFSVTSQV